MNRLLAFVCVAALFVVLACGEAASPQDPAPPLPAVAAPTTMAAHTAQLAVPATPLPPAAAPTAEPVATVHVPRPATPAPPRPTAVATPVPTPTPAIFPVTVVDSMGRDITFEKPPERIVAFDSAALEILFAIGEGDRVVATHEFVTYPPEAGDVPKVGSAFSMNIEAIVALEPDLVFIFFDRFLPDLERAGLKVYYVETLNDDFTKIADSIRMWGRVTGGVAPAEALADDFERRVERVKETMASYESGMSVFQDLGDLWTPGNDTLIAEVFELLKLSNIAYDVSGYVQMSPEVIVERNPQMVIALFGETIDANPVFSEVSAVKNGRIFVPTSADALSVAGPRYVDGIEELARWVYPGIFR